MTIQEQACEKDVFRTMHICVLQYIVMYWNYFPPRPYSRRCACSLGFWILSENVRPAPHYFDSDYIGSIRA